MILVSVLNPQGVGQDLREMSVDIFARSRPNKGEFEALHFATVIPTAEWNLLSMIHWPNILFGGLPLKFSLCLFLRIRSLVSPSRAQNRAAARGQRARPERKRHKEGSRPPIKESAKTRESSDAPALILPFLFNTRCVLLETDYVWETCPIPIQYFNTCIPFLWR